MVDSGTVNIGFISPRSASSPHFDTFRALFPPGVEMDFAGLELAPGSLYELEGKLDLVLQRVPQLAEQHAWDGVIVSGAPLEVLNPGLYQRMEAVLDVPVVTALSACISALSAYSAARVLLLTPFDEPLIKLIRDHLAAAGIDAVSPPQLFADYTDAFSLGPEEVFRLASKARDDVGAVDAIYFQGAPFDPIKVIHRLEEDLRTTVVASNPAMLWAILSKLGRTHHIHGTGKLLDEWPKIP